MLQAATAIDTDKPSYTGPFVPGHLFSAKSPAYTQSVKQIQQILDDYLAYCDTKDKPPTIPGIAKSLGFNSREALWRFINKSEHLKNGNQRKRDAIINTIQRVKLHIEDVRVSDMVAGKGSTAGAIFDLKNNFNYRDQVDVVQDTHMTIRWASDIAPIDAQVVDNKEQIPETTGSS